MEKLKARDAYNLGVKHCYGVKGFSKNYFKGLDYFILAKKLGFKPEQDEALSVFYLKDSEEIKKSFENQLTRMEKAAKAGIKSCMRELIEMYENGGITGKDKKKADYWRTKLNQ